MKTHELEARVRDMLHERANQVTESDLSRSTLQAPKPTLVRRADPAQGRGLMTAAAAVLLVLGLVAAGLVGRGDGTAVETPVLDGRPGPGVVQAEETPARAWPLTNDESLNAAAPEGRFADAESAARAYLTEVVNLPADWPLERVEADGRHAVASYVLQDVPAGIGLAADADGLWYVAAAETEFLESAEPVLTPGGADVSIGGGPRAHDDMSVRVSALAADGRLLASRMVQAQPQPDGEAAAARVVSLEWRGPELPAAVRADVLSDHDADPSTADVTVGHWTRGVGAPGLPGLPASFDAASAEPVFSASGSYEAVARSFMQARLPDRSVPEINLAPVGTRGDRAYVTWGAGSYVSPGQPADGRAHRVEHQASGILALRVADDGWAVVAATTYGVDLSALAVNEGRVTGPITTDNPNALFADVLTLDGEPVAGAPRPEGQPGADYRIGTAGGPSNGSMELDVPVEPGSVVLQVRLVGGTVLSISEVRMPAPAP